MVKADQSQLQVSNRSSNDICMSSSPAGLLCCSWQTAAELVSASHARGMPGVCSVKACGHATAAYSMEGSAQASLSRLVFESQCLVHAFDHQHSWQLMQTDSEDISAPYLHQSQTA